MAEPKAIEKLNQLLVDSVINPPETITVPRTLLVEFLADYQLIRKRYLDFNYKISKALDSVIEVVNEDDNHG